MQGIERGLRVLEAVAEHQPVGVGELSRTLGLPKSTVQRTLLGLSNAGWIRSDGSEYTRWKLTSRALAVGRRGWDKGDLRGVALEPMRELRDLTNETITLQVRDGAERTVQIERMDSQQAVRTYIKLGSSWQLPHTSGGLAIMSRLPDDEVDRLLASPIEKLTPQTDTDPDSIRRKLEDIREVGYAVSINQNRMGVCAIGAAVLGDDGGPIGGVGISMPESRFDEQRVPWWGKQVKATAQIIESLV
ncbi:IclR family transcriptional regulator [Antrihabitans sp. YC2-6]|uniref:IclR family transcriptional regulator n=1 Tax=Antrihabitans sp. YC2-6 TaxID=2799498 RepID=UPI0018F57FDC|nr:IclR family transcriptional regulator [Antrihabitans sp. YC2-6]MBJ8347141.1 IclR family transcriptional regulator [Antrihabitans sp. YC2-6]